MLHSVTISTANNSSLSNKYSVVFMNTNRSLRIYEARSSLWITLVMLHHAGSINTSCFVHIFMVNVVCSTVVCFKMLPHQGKTQYLHFRIHVNYFLLPQKIPEDNQYFSITKGSIYHIKHMYIQPFAKIVYFPDIWCLMEVSTLFYICRYWVFTTAERKSRGFIMEMPNWLIRMV